jgi:DNA-binding SARP family transcriptional activator
MVYVRTLGTASIDAGTAHLTPASVRKFALFLYLWAERGRCVARGTLQDLIFPDQTAVNARHSIRELVYRFRKAGARIASSGETVVLAPESVCADYTDVLGCERPTIDQLRAAHGGFLPGYAPTHSEAFTEWLEALRARSVAELNRAFVAELARSRRLADWVSAEMAAKAVLTLDPLNEEATLASAELLAMSGAKAQALKLLDEYVKEVGAASSDLKLPAALLRRRISERSREIYRPPLTLPFLGRDAEMTALQERFARTRGGEAQCVVIVGEAGIGKTRLAEELCTQAVLAGATVERVAMQPHDVHRPMATFADLVPKLLALPGALGCSPESMIALKRLVVDEIDPTVPTGEVPSGAIASAIAHAISDLVDAVATESTLVLFVDDTQWTDERSQQMLRSLTSCRHPRRLMVVLTCRADETLRRVAQNGLASLSMRLAPLAIDQLRELTTRALIDRDAAADAELRDWIAATSGGNPLFLKCLINHYHATGERFVVPSTLSALLDQEIAALTADGATALRMCVVLSRHCTLGRLSAALDLPHIELQRCMLELERTHLVVLDQGRVHAGHSLIAEAAERGAPPIALALMHRRVAILLEDEIDHAGESSALWDCAEHWILAGDDARATHVVRECAARATQIGRPREAAEALLRAAAMVSGTRRTELAHEAVQLADSANESDVVVRGFHFAKQHGLCIEFDGSELAELIATQLEWRSPDQLKEKLLLWTTSDRTPRQRLRAALSALIFADNHGDRDVATKIFQCLKDFPADLESSLQPILLECLLIYHSSFGDIDDSRAVATHLLALADRMDPQSAADARRKAAVALWRLGDTSSALCALEAAYADAVASGLARLQLGIAAGIATGFSDLADTPRQNAWLAEADRVAREAPALRSTTMYLAVHTDIACVTGDDRTMREALERALTSIERTRIGRPGRWHRVFELRLHRLNGSIRDIDAAVDELLSHQKPGFEVGEVSDAEIAVAIEILVAAGQRARAVEIFERYINDYRRVRSPLSRWIRNALEDPLVQALG